MEKRLKTKILNFYDDEIEFIYPNGDIHLKEGVRRRPTLDTDETEETYINEVDLLVQKRKKKKEEQTNEYDNEEVREY